MKGSRFVPNLGDESTAVMGPQAVDNLPKEMPEQVAEQWVQRFSAPHFLPGPYETGFRTIPRLRVQSHSSLCVGQNLRDATVLRREQIHPASSVGCPF